MSIQSRSEERLACSPAAEAFTKAVRDFQQRVQGGKFDGTYKDVSDAAVEFARLGAVLCDNAIVVRADENGDPYYQEALVVAETFSSLQTTHADLGLPGGTFVTIADAVEFLQGDVSRLLGRITPDKLAGFQKLVKELQEHRLID